MDLNRPAPDFELPSLDGRFHRLSDYRGQIIVVNFWSADCPHVVRTDASMLTALNRWGTDVVLLTIASNVNESAEVLENAARSRGLPLVLKDAGHIVADLYAAQVTPEAQWTTPRFASASGRVRIWMRRWTPFYRAAYRRRLSPRPLAVPLSATLDSC
jgi:peroxiredoxin